MLAYGFVIKILQRLKNNMHIGFSKKYISPESDRSRIVIVSIISILPALALFFFITKYWVNIPFWDQWGFSIIFDKYYSKTLTFYDLIAQHNESRKLFPRLIVLAAGSMTKWNICVEICITMFFACLISFNLFTLLNRTENLNILNKLTLLLIINLLLFSPIQWGDRPWAIMMMYMPALALTAGLVINTTDISIRAKVIYNSILSIISTFSYANGMLVWLLLLPVNAFFKTQHYRHKRKIRNEFFYIFLYVITALLTIGFYFRHYQRPFHHPSLSVAFYMPIEAVRFFLIWVGSLFVPSHGPYAATLKSPLFIGGLLFCTFVLSSTYCMYRGYKNSSKLSFFYPWFILGLYSIISGIVTTLGRLGLGISAAVANRYTVVSIYLPISIVVLVYLIYVFYIRDKKIIAKRFLAIQTFAILFFLILYSCVYRASLEAMRWCNKYLQDGKLALQFYKVIPDNKNLNLLHPNPQFLVERFSSLTKIGLLDFKPVEPDILKYLENVNKDGNRANGVFTECLLLADDKLKVYGWVEHATGKILTNNAMFVYTDKNGNSKPFAILSVRGKRALVVKAFKPLIMSTYHFWGKIDVNHLPAGDLQISAWTVDVKEGIAYQLAGTHSIRKF